MLVLFCLKEKQEWSSSRCKDNCQGQHVIRDLTCCKMKAIQWITTLNFIKLGNRTFIDSSSNKWSVQLMSSFLKILEKRVMQVTISDYFITKFRNLNLSRSQVWRFFKVVDSQFGLHLVSLSQCNRNITWKCFHVN